MNVRIIFAGIAVCSVVWCCPQLALSQNQSSAPSGPGIGYAALFNENCAVCHGEQLQGAAQGTSLMGSLKHGDSMEALIKSISDGFPAQGMPSWAATMKPEVIKSLALYVAETRSNFDYVDFNVSNQLEIPAATTTTQLHTFRLHTVIDGLDPLPYSIQPLPDGRILLTEKTRGLSIISADGVQGPLIEGTPKAYSDTMSPGLELQYGLGWLLDVALHPKYEDNGWIYLSFGDRCTACNTISNTSKLPVSMVKLVRGKINNNQWVEQETIWEADKAQYGPAPDMAAGGRIAFDKQGHVFLSIGMKGLDNHTGIQSLRVPWGKIMRFNEDGTVPSDNPFVNTADALPSIWSLGHRSPQGLEFNYATSELWETEMGPRGGDEVNRILPGHNYGWPLYSKGLNYDGTPVDYGKTMNIKYDLKDIDQPVVDLTPSPAVSSFIFYTGDKFPKWKNNIIVGSLKARSVYRIAIENNEESQRETLVDGLARIRDIEQDPAGNILLLLEHKSGGQIVRMSPP